MSLALMLLADGRFPAGGHAHSAGVEAAVGDGRVFDEDSLEAFLFGRLHTAGLTEAALAAAAFAAFAQPCRPGGTPLCESVLELDAEAAARLPLPWLRSSSRRLGRQLVRAAGRCWPGPSLVVVADALPEGACLPVALGAAGVAAGLGIDEVALLSLHGLLTTAAQAGVRLLGLDPFAVAAIVARLGVEAASVGVDAVLLSSLPLADLPARSGVIPDIAAADHARSDERLFVT
jgi:urease accessory protein